MGSRLYTDTQEEGSRFVRAGKGRFDLAARQRSGIEDHVAAINQCTRQQLGEMLHTMPAKRFEEMVMQLLLKMGFDESTLPGTTLFVETNLAQPKLMWSTATADSDGNRFAFPSA